MPFDNPVTAGTSLVIPAINSPNYVPGSVGWSIMRNGSAEFSSGVFRGVISAGGSVFGNLSILSPSGDATGATDTGNIATVLAGGGTPLLTPGTWYVNCGNATLTSLTTGQYIWCCGEATLINALGSGDLFRWLFTGSYSGSTTIGGGLLGYPMIDGSGTTGNANAIRAGDIESLRFFVNVRHFSKGSASWGVLFDNQNWFTERLLVDLNVLDCGNTPGNGGHVGFNVGGALTSTDSFKAFAGRVRISQSAGTNQQDGLVLMNGARIYDSTRFEMTGNFTSQGGATTAAAVRITGQVPAGHPNAGGYSQIDHGELVWTPECNALGANPPVDIAFGSAGNNRIYDCHGFMDWGGDGTFAQTVNSFKSFYFDGPVYGDAQLKRNTGLGQQPYSNGAITNGAAIQTVSSLSTAFPASAVTGIIMADGDPNQNQTHTLVNSGSGSITFATQPTSHVNGGATVVIPAGSAMTFTWIASAFTWYPASPPQQLTSFLTADQGACSSTTQSTVLGPVSLDPGAYWFEAEVKLTASSTRLAYITMGGTATASAFAAEITYGQVSDTTTGAAQDWSVEQATLGDNTGLGMGHAMVSGEVYNVRIRGYITVSAAGTVTVNQASSANATSFTVNALSVLKVYPQ